MTKEQAIKLLRKETSPMEIHILTIEGLKQSEIMDKIQEAMDMGADAIKKQTWISVKDRLPEDDERYKDRKVIDVLVSTDRGIVTKVQRISNKGYWYWGRIFSNIIAWMPLPNKYISEE